MAIHPPMLYLGYVGFTVPFAFAIAALATGRLGEGWLVATRRWTLIAWGFLTVGIVLGAWWSYEVLGWGGYWAWDPVENASFLPWLTGTAFLHSVMVQERRGMLRVWNLSLLCATFALTILGTFLTRSGVLDSVHAFTESLDRPVAARLLRARRAWSRAGSSAWRGDELRSPGPHRRRPQPGGRRSSLNNLLFAAFAFVVLLGTVFPLLVEALTGDRITVGEPYFDRMAMPDRPRAAVPHGGRAGAAVAQGVDRDPAPRGCTGRRGSATACARARRRCSAPAGSRRCSPSASAGSPPAPPLRQVVLATRRQGWRGLVGRTNGGMVVHLGVVIIAVGLAAVVELRHRARGHAWPRASRRRVAGHTLELVGHRGRRDRRPHRVPRPRLDRRRPDVRAGGAASSATASQTIGTPSVRTTAFEDVYLSLLPGADPEAGTVNLRVIVPPLVVWLWIGGVLMFVGTVLAAFPGRRRDPLDPVSADVARPEPELVEPRRLVTDDGRDDEAVAEQPVGDRRRVVVSCSPCSSSRAGHAGAGGRTGWPTARSSGGRRPPLAGTTLDGDAFDLADAPRRVDARQLLRHVVRAVPREHDDLGGFHDRHAEIGDASVVERRVRRHRRGRPGVLRGGGGDWPVVVGDQGDIALDYGVIKVPESYLVSPDGVVVKKLIGGVTQEFLEELLAAAEQQAG